MKGANTHTVAICIGITLISAALAGCYPAYRQPAVSFNPVPSIQTSEDGVRVTVIPSYWPGSPRNLPSFVTPFYVEIENFSGNPITVSYKDLVMFDEFRTQYGPINPNTVADVLSTSDFNYVAYPSVSVGFGYGGWGGPWGGGWGYYRPFYRPYYAYAPFWYYPPPVYYYPVPVSTKDVVTGALMPGTVYPNASIEGFIYFKELPETVSRVTLDVGYVNSSNDVFRSLSFPFTSTAVIGGQ
ncbi:MAG TPA: hypothetical protein PKC29_08340 [Thermodesulfobacteriota bacterium]|nr:hypothetical protein [Thermodesulfobacteriota bacterium]